MLNIKKLFTKILEDIRTSRLYDLSGSPQSMWNSIDTNMGGRLSDATEVGLYWIYDPYFEPAPDGPADAPTPFKLIVEGLAPNDLTASGPSVCQTIVTVDNKIYTRCKLAGREWTEWVQVSGSGIACIRPIVEVYVNAGGWMAVKNHGPSPTTGSFNVNIQTLRADSQSGSLSFEYEANPYFLEGNCHFVVKEQSGFLCACGNVFAFDDIPVDTEIVIGRIVNWAAVEDALCSTFTFGD